jgi:uncharacterized membrane protein YGL010W
MKGIQTWLDDYGISHQNPTNKLIHWICVPLIFFSITGLFYSVELPFKIGSDMNFNLAIIMLAGVVAYYFFLSRTLWIGMLLFASVCMLICYEMKQSGISLWLVSIVTFVLAWIGQFYGHHVEGKKPSFIHDLQFLMIGPAWLMSFIYKRLGIPY